MNQPKAEPQLEPALVFSVELKGTVVVTVSFDQPDTYWSEQELRNVVLDRVLDQLGNDQEDIIESYRLIEVRGTV